MIVFGSSGHAREISSFLKSKNQKEVSCYVSEKVGKLKDVPVIDESQLENNLLKAKEDTMAIVAIGSGNIRKKIVDKFSVYHNLIFPNFFLGEEFDMASIGLGNVFFPTFYITVNAVMGNHNHFNLKTTVSHDAVIGNYNTFSPNVTIAGNVKIGDNVFFGIGVCVIDNISICSNVVIGAGTVVTKNITSSGTYVGVPAKKIK